jgi:hypothetical protein
LKEFEALAREALGSDEGFAPVDESAIGDHSHKTPSEAIAHVGEELAEAEAQREHEALATSEGMPSGQLDEDPPTVKSAAAGE